MWNFELNLYCLGNKNNNIKIILQPQIVYHATNSQKKTDAVLLLKLTLVYVRIARDRASHFIEIKFNSQGRYRNYIWISNSRASK